MCLKDRLGGCNLSLLLLSDKAVNRVATEDVHQSLCCVINAPVIMIISHKRTQHSVYVNRVFFLCVCRGLHSPVIIEILHLSRSPSSGEGFSRPACFWDEPMFVHRRDTRWLEALMTRTTPCHYSMTSQFSTWLCLLPLHPPTDGVTPKWLCFSLLLCAAEK